MKLENVETQNEKYEKELVDLEINLANVETQNEKYEKELDDLEMKLKNVETHNEKYEKELVDLEMKLKNVETQNEKYEKELDDLEMKLKNVETQNEKYEKELVYLEIDLENVETQNEKYEKELDDMEIKLKNVETQNEKYEKELVDLEIDLENVETRNEKYEKELADLEMKLKNVETQNEKYEKELDDLEMKLKNVETQNEKYEKQQDKMEIKLGNALALLEACLVKKLADYTYLEILEATDNLSPLRKIGEGGFGNTYRGLLHHTEVAIKVLSSDNMQGPQEFKQEVDTLSRLRHPNIVTLIGVCSEASALIYEYLPNGSLEDRLFCKDNTPPLTWKARICIVAELCSALIFMHSCQPESIIHRDLKPDNVLLDARLSCKLSDFGICRAIDINMTRAYKTEPKGTFSYMDPEFRHTRKLTPKSDVYSFEIILLQLLTKKSPLEVIHEVQTALDSDNLIAVLDPSAGEWPYEQAKQLAFLGLRCCEMLRLNRPDLEADVWRVLGPMKFSAMSSDESEDEPSYFTCPITQEVMQDPQIAADGFTYEGEYLRGWLDSGHDTSPMTNLRLENQTLIPNRALRSAIQEWLQRRCSLMHIIAKVELE